MPKGKRVLFEEWRRAPDCPGYWVSNLGRIARGNNAPEYELKVSESQDKYKEPICRLSIDGKLRTRHLSRLVYIAFSDDPPQFKNFRTYALDGNRKNCRIDNLGTALPQSKARTAEQIKAYEAWCTPSIKRYIAQQKLNDVGRGFDVDNFIGEASLLLWKYLPGYNPRTKFITWGRKYMRFAFLKEYNRHGYDIKHLDWR